MMARQWSPVQGLLVALLFMLLAAATATGLALRAPWLGLQWQPVSEDPAGVGLLATAVPGSAQALGSSAHVPAHARVLRLRSPVSGGVMDLQGDDLIEEPDFFDTYPQMQAFYARQTQLDALLQTPLQLVWQAADGREQVLSVVPRPRPLSSLPAVFWFQLLTGSAGFLIAAWVYSLRPQDWGARMLALTGLMFPLFTLPAAVYSTRELALPGDLFRTLAALNHLGAFMFGCALVGLFLCYPQRLVKPRTLLWLPLVFGGWWLADAWQIAPDQDVGSRWPVMLELILAIFCAFLQWRKSRHEPADRAALRWLILSVVVGCGLFVFTTAGASMLGLFPPVSQGYSFGYFLIMYFGLALGVRRYRLFELDEWAYRILLWVAGALLVIGMDVLMIWMLGLRQDLSLGLALFVAGWLYFPVRQWLWRRWRGTRRFSFDAVLPALSQIAFAAVADAREQGWDHLLQEVYAPLTLHAEQPGGVNRVNRVSHVEVSADGLLLHVPACGRLAARRLHYADGGRRLFGAQDVEFMTSLCHLMNEADRGREAYERGVVQERSRIARDMHDDIGARLLTLTHRLRDPQEAELARAAIQDLRTTLGALEMQPKPLGDALADWRAEIESRCEAAAVVLHWQQAEDLSGYCLSARAKAMLERVLREAISNALRHAAARRIRVWQTLERDGLQLVIEDDGQATEAFLPEEGYGLASMQHRLDELGGRLQMTVAAAGHGLRLTVSLPLQSLDIS